MLKGISFIFCCSVSIIATRASLRVLSHIEQVLFHLFIQAIISTYFNTLSYLRKLNYVVVQVFFLLVWRLGDSLDWWRLTRWALWHRLRSCWTDHLLQVSLLARGLPLWDRLGGYRCVAVCFLLHRQQILVPHMFVREALLWLPSAFIIRLPVELHLFFSNVQLGLDFRGSLQVEDILAKLEQTLQLRRLNLSQCILLVIDLLAGRLICTCCDLHTLGLRVFFFVVVTFIDGASFDPDSGLGLLSLPLHFRVASWAETFHEAASCFCSCWSTLYHIYWLRFF